MNNDNRIIDIDDDLQADDDRPQEIPVFSLESVPEATADTPSAGRPVRKAPVWMTVVLIVLGIAVVIFVFRYFYGDESGVTSSLTDKQNLALLADTPPGTAAGTSVKSDSVLGVALDMYSLDGLRASLEQELPDTADRSLVLFMRSADYHPDGSLEGTLVLGGKRLKSRSRVERRGYIAISSAGVPAIGISNSDLMAEAMADGGGSMFRQYVLLGDGQLPSTFRLHGKVERGAIGRMADGRLYYVLTRHKETLYDFADAMREYGFVDAVYITGGNGYDFHRTPDGVAHVSDAVREKIDKYSEAELPAPLLVFRTNMVEK